MTHMLSVYDQKTWTFTCVKLKMRKEGGVVVSLYRPPVGMSCRHWGGFDTSLACSSHLISHRTGRRHDAGTVSPLAIKLLLTLALTMQDASIV